MKKDPFKTLVLSFDGAPPRRTAQQKGVSTRGYRVRFYTKDFIRRERDKMVFEMRRQLPPDWVPRREPAKVSVCLVYPLRKCERVPEDALLPHVQRPDADNLVKQILDSLVLAGAICDDSIVFDLHVRKWRALFPRWDVRLDFGGYGFLGGVRLALDELWAAIREVRRVNRRMDKAAGQGWLGI